MNPALPQSQTQLLQLYNNKITSLNPNLSPSIAGSDLYFKGNATTQVAANVIQDTQLALNNVFAASSSGTYQDKHAGNVGMTPRMGATPSIGTCTLNGSGTSSVVYVIYSGTLLQDTITNVQYQTLQDVSIAIGDTINAIILPISSVLLGTSTVSPIGDDLNFLTPFNIGVVNIVTATLVSLTSGMDFESDNQFALRIFNFSQNPRGGGSVGDYYSWCFLGDPVNVTGATIISTNLLNNQNILFPVILIGNPNPNFYVDGTSEQTPTPYIQTYPQNRTAISTIISSVQSYIDGVKAVNTNPQTLTVATYILQATDPVFIGVTNAFVVNVSLTPGITLSSLFTLPNNNTITVSQLIQREFRRAILSTPLGGLTINQLNNEVPPVIVTNQAIPLGDISDIIMQGLGNSGIIQGNFISAIIGIEIIYLKNNVDAGSYIILPSLNSSNLFNVNLQAYLIYDIDIGLGLNPSIITVNDISQTYVPTL